MSPPRVLIVVPAHDEEESLPATLAEVRERAPGIDALVVDDGSRDRTAERARAAGATTAARSAGSCCPSASSWTATS